MPAPELDIAVTHGPEGARVGVAGEIDLATADRLRDAVDGELRAGRHVVLDLAGVEFMDSSGLNVILRAVQSAERNGWSFAVAPTLSVAATRVARVSGVLETLPLAAA